MKYEKHFSSVTFIPQKQAILKPFLLLLLYLNIYTIFSETLQAQNLYLEIDTRETISNGLRDSLNLPVSFGNFKGLKTTADSLSIRFRKLGFLEAEQTELKPKNDSVYVAQYALGNRWRYIQIHYPTETFDISEVKKISSTATDSSLTLPIVRLEPALQQLNDLLIARGDPFAKVSLSEITPIDDRTLTARLNTQLYSARTIDDIVVKGYDRFPSSFLRYYAGIKKGMKYDQEKLIEKNGILNNLGFVKTIKAPEVLFRKDSTEVYLYLEKRNHNLFDGILGFATNEETEKLEFNGYLNLELNNNLHFGEQLLINYKSDGREQQNFRVRTQLPYLFKSPLGISLELKIFKRDSTFSTTDQQARMTYQLNPNSEVFVGYKSYESSNLLDEDIGGTIADYKANYMLAGASYLKRQASEFFPIKTYIALDTEIGSRKIDEQQQAQFRLNGRIYHTFQLNLRNSIYLNNESGLLSSDNYLTNELYRFGGINSIRGFSENSIDASVYTVLNTEYRYLFNRTTYVHSIVDFAYFENAVLSLQEELYSFGIGLGILTEAGVFRLNIANGISAEQNFKFSNTKIHLSLSTRF